MHYKLDTFKTCYKTDKHLSPFAPELLFPYKEDIECLTIPLNIFWTKSGYIFFYFDYYYFQASKGYFFTCKRKKTILSFKKWMKWNMNKYKCIIKGKINN